MKKLAHPLTLAIVGASLFSGCHHAGKHATGFRGCDETCTAAAASYGGYPSQTTPQAPGAIQTPANPPQLLPPAEPPKQVPPADEFLPPVKGPINPPAAAE